MTLWGTLAGAWREFVRRLGDAPLRWPEDGAAWRSFMVVMAGAVLVGVVLAVALAPIWLTWLVFVSIYVSASMFLFGL